MMNAKILIIVLLILASNISAQKAAPTGQTSQNSDELLKHLSAAETFQISGDLANATIENRAILGIALQRVGNIAIEEGKYDDAVNLLNQALIYEDSAPNRINLAIAYQRLNQFDKADCIQHLMIAAILPIIFL